MFEWDARKDRANRAKHGVGLDLAERFDWASALIVEDDRFDYGETRFVAYGLADTGKGYAIVFTIRGKAIRIMSVRRMNKREGQSYAKEINRPPDEG